MYDPLKLTSIIEKQVVSGIQKKYYRFRPTRFYGGIATADTVGCNLRCIFCWSDRSVWHSRETGVFYTPEDVAEKLHQIAYEHGFHQIRTSGGEPTIGRKHLLKLLDSIDRKLLFILETNGILLGFDPSYVEELSSFHNIHVRVSIKGCTPDEFSWFTNCRREGFTYQLRSLSNLLDQNISFHISIVTLSDNRQEFYHELQKMGLGEIMLEEEIIHLYPKVRQRLYRRRILDRFLSSLERK
ncbi:MAG: molybdenum cofactor biosynthesis protein MoaA [Thermoplasmata archaeon]|nr:MAG: molybdenum cofactor biosynthesis protein MoaA [Thermoplasmata archaeon]